jgi:hypothetical protein
MYLKNCVLVMLTCLTAVGSLAEDYVIEDDGVGMSLEELTYLVKYWSPEMQQAAAKDRGRSRQRDPRKQSREVLAQSVPYPHYPHQVCSE